MNFKKIGFPFIMLVVGIASSACEFFSSINDKSLEEKIEDEVRRQLNQTEEAE